MLRGNVIYSLKLESIFRFLILRHYVNLWWCGVRSGICVIPCKEFPTFYIGGTCRALEKRKYKRDLRHAREPSAYFFNLRDECHKLKITQNWCRNQWIRTKERVKSPLDYNSWGIQYVTHLFRLYCGSN